MNYTLDTELILSSIKCSYIIVSAHRHRNPPQKSKWTIAPNKEVAIFTHAIKNNWKENNGYISWGALKNGSKTLVLGKNCLGENLHISKFVDGNNNNMWHGYPADYIRNIQDRPAMKILVLWRNAGIIKKKHAAKIRNGIPCNL
jgi:hypothetical protein